MNWNLEKPCLILFYPEFFFIEILLNRFLKLFHECLIANKNKPKVFVPIPGGFIPGVSIGSVGQPSIEKPSETTIPAATQSQPIVSKSSEVIATENRAKAAANETAEQSSLWWSFWSWVFVFGCAFELTDTQNFRTSNLRHHLLSKNLSFCFFQCNLFQQNVGHEECLLYVKTCKKIKYQQKLKCSVWSHNWFLKISVLFCFVFRV